MNEYESLVQQVRSLAIRMEQMEHAVTDHSKRFDTLQTRWWKRLWFRVDGWPGQRNLNADARSWRPWH